MKFASLFWLTVFVSQSVLHADEMQTSSQWVGSIKSDSGETSNARIIIKERKGIDVTCELWWENDSRGLAFAGTVSETGAVVLKVTKEIKGTFLKDLVDNGRFRGTLSGKNLTGQWGVPGKNARFGELKLRLKE